MKKGTLAFALATMLLPTAAVGQGWIVGPDDRPADVVVSAHTVDAAVNHQVATVTSTTTFRNAGRGTVEGTFIFPLPAGAAVSSFSLEINGEPVKGELLEAGRARDVYERIVRNALDPALLEWIDDGLFRARVFPIAAGEERRISVSYDLVLDRDGERVRVLLPLTGDVSTTFGRRPPPIRSRPGSDATGDRTLDGDRPIRITISSDAEVRGVYSPTHVVDVDRRRGRTVVEATRALNRAGRSLVLYYSLSRDHLAATVFAHRPYAGSDGYYMLMLDPPVALASSRVQPRDLLFILDTSGSMAGAKLKQAKEALSYALNRLGTDDRFAILNFSSDVRVFSDKLEPTASVEDALFYISKLEARGGTNINGALERGLSMLSGSRTSTVVFLTDGLPSTGVVDVGAILSNAANANESNARIFSFGVGYDVNTTLLDGLSRASRAFADYIAPEENIEERVSAFYEKVRYPVMTDVSISTTGIPVARMAPRYPGDLFLGEPLVVTGRYQRPGEVTFVVSGTIDGQRITQEVAMSMPRVERESEFVARIWASRRIGELLESVRLEGENEALVEEIVGLSKEFGIVTPYTSYLVQEDEAPIAYLPRPTDPRRRHGARTATAEHDLAGIQESSGQAAVAMSREIQRLKQTAVATPQSEANLVAVGGQTFVQQRDDSWLTQADTTGMPTWGVAFGSDAYFAFLRAYPDASDYLAVGSKVSFVFRKVLVEVGTSGVTSVTTAELESRFGA